MYRALQLEYTSHVKKHNMAKTYYTKGISFAEYNNYIPVLMASKTTANK